MQEGILTNATRTVSWPSEPYKGLNFYSAADWPLFAEREDDVLWCSNLLQRSTTKVLLLHGRSGTGKSSFLRAGLLPFLASTEIPYTWLKTKASDSEPFIIRCTDNPVLRFSGALRSSSENPRDLLGLSQERRSALKSILADRTGTIDDVANRLYESLYVVTMGIRSPLVVVIDQAEEVLTLSNAATDGPKRKAFFELIERLCVQPLDLKVVVCLRTEYYGQFTDWFRISTDINCVQSRLRPRTLYAARYQGKKTAYPSD